ncbi:MAG TPA: hypothetical protein VG347_03475 [Verrucomicrobiae bacterium]|nr:hypothetical protein [Verrucomicrobiae bacterium]
MPAQPSNSWSVQLLNADYSLSGQPVTLATLGIEDFVIEEENLAAHVGTFTVGGKAFDAASLWPYGQNLAVLRPDGTREFVGRVEPWSRSASSDAQNHSGRVMNGWWYLERKIYEQRYSITTGNYPVAGSTTPQTYTVISTPRVVLNVLFNGINGTGFFQASTGQQIADAINWAILQGAPIALGVTEPATMPFSDMQKGVLCADVIKLMFRKEPDFVVDWDYTTVPFPTIHFRKASLKPITIDLTSTTVREAISIKERPDWQRSYVKINYDQTNSTPNGQFIATYADWYSALGQGNSVSGAPSGAALPGDIESKFRGVDLFCDLSGGSSTATSQTASFASKQFDFTSLQTWQYWKPSLQAGTVSTASILLAGFGADASRPAPVIVPIDELDAAGNALPYDPTCVYEVVDGQWADWIPKVNSQRLRATAWAKITNKNGDVRYEHLTKELTAVNLNTNSISQTFTAGATNIKQYAEPVPVGLAQSMWKSWQNLAIEGSFTDVEAVAGATQNITLSNSLNFKTANPGVNGQPDWRNVQARVQSRRRSIKNGTTRIQFGAPLKITGHELIDAVRATRYRVTTIDLTVLFGGQVGSGTSNVRQGRKTHAHHTQHGGTHSEVGVISGAVNPVPGTDPIIKHDGTTGISSWEPAANGAPTIILDPSRAKGSDGKWHTLIVQEQKVCVKINGVLKQRTLLALTSEFYQAQDDPA